MRCYEKSIDLSLFTRTNSGGISWIENVGKICIFTYNDIAHSLKILSYDPPKIKVCIDDKYIFDTYPSCIHNVGFEKYVHTHNYKYKVGDIVNNVEILQQVFNEKNNMKCYQVRCLTDNYIYEVDEYSLNKGYSRCAVCKNIKIIPSINDIATTHPHLIKYFANKEDSTKYSYGSNKKCVFRCPICGEEKTMTISEFVIDGFSCPFCSDGWSYPNKFAHELFSQLSNQLTLYDYEYSPDWAGKYKYDNYIQLLNGEKYIVEFDGALHYIYTDNSDAIKDELAISQNISVIRVDCFYSHVSNRFQHIKNNVIKELGHILDLSMVDWGKCDLVGNTSKYVMAFECYNKSKYISLEYVCKKVGIHKSTAIEYLKHAHEMGLCVYDGKSKNRDPRIMAVAMYSLDGELLNVYRSYDQLKEQNPDKDWSLTMIRRSVVQGTGEYKGYIFKNLTLNEFIEYDLSINN